MGESGEGSLEPGVASGDEFVVRYPNKFLDYFYDANPLELSNAEAEDSDSSNSLDTAESENAEDIDSVKHAAKLSKVERPAIFGYLTLESNKLIMSGPRRGEYTSQYKYIFAAPHSP